MIKNTKIFRLAECVYHLGFNFGYRWWKFQNSINQDPKILLRVALRMDGEAEVDPSDDMAAALRSSAEMLRECYNNNINHKNP